MDSTKGTVNSVIHYLDVFLVIGAPYSPECVAALTMLLRVFDLLGLPVAVEKLEALVFSCHF